MHDELSRWDMYGILRSEPQLVEIGDYIKSAFLLALVRAGSVT
jgi:hypothetical protein